MTAGIAIVGAGQAAASCAQELRRRKVDAPIVIFGDEDHLPYQRPPLSKAFLKESHAVERLLLLPPQFFASNGIELRRGGRVTSIGAAARRLVCADGVAHDWSSLVLATGTRARPVAMPGQDLRGVFTLRGLADVERLRPAIARAGRIAILGGGFIGLEVAAVCRSLGLDVTVVEAEDRLLKRVTAPVMSNFFETLHRDHGVAFHFGVRAAAILGTDKVAGIGLHDGREVAADVVLMALGAEPNTELAAAAGIELANGIVVDELGRTAVPEIYACGDCTRFPSQRFEANIRLESVQNAIDQGKAVAATIAGQQDAYDPVPWFWSDQYDVKLQIAGLSTGYDELLVDGDAASPSFAVEYRRRGRLIAVDSINAARAHMLARRRIDADTRARPSA